jgi:signal transduction histidine kinase
MRRWFVTRANPFHDSAGRLAGWIGIGTDIDDEKRAQIALTAALRAREEALAAVSHDLRNPIGLVMLAAGQLARLAEEGAPPARIDKAVHTIVKSAERMTRLVRDLLDLSKLAAGKSLPLKLERHEVVYLVRQSMDLLAPLAAAGRLTLAVDLPAGPLYAETRHGGIGLGFRSPRRSSRRTAGVSPSRARRGKGVSSPLLCRRRTT